MGTRPTLKPIVTQVQEEGGVEAAIAKIESEIEQGIEAQVERFSAEPEDRRRYLHEPPMLFAVSHDYGDTNNVRVVHNDTDAARSGCPVCP